MHTCRQEACTPMGPTRPGAPGLAVLISGAGRLRRQPDDSPVERGSPGVGQLRGVDLEAVGVFRSAGAPGELLGWCGVGATCSIGIYRYTRRVIWVESNRERPVCAGTLPSAQAHDLACLFAAEPYRLCKRRILGVGYTEHGPYLDSLMVRVDGGGSAQNPTEPEEQSGQPDRCYSQAYIGTFRRCKSDCNRQSFPM